MVLFKFDPSHPGLRKTLKEYEELTFRYVLEVGEVGANSSDTWRHVNERMGNGRIVARAI
jgi:hypothetical protein